MNRTNFSLVAEQKFQEKENEKHIAKIEVILDNFEKSATFFMKKFSNIFVIHVGFILVLYYKHKVLKTKHFINQQKYNIKFQKTQKKK